jgi:hypothetical protein
MKNLIMIVFLMQGCFTSNPNKVQNIDTLIQPKGQVGSQVVGLNDKDEIIMQEEQNAADELRIQKAVNLKYQDELDRVAFDLNRCRKDMSDPRLGGKGVLPEAVEVDGIKIAEDIKEAIGLTENGELKVVRKTYFIEQLKIERKFGASLERMNKIISRQNKECEYAMGIARRKAGLPSERYQGSGYFSHGVWVQTVPNENSLDDAFRIQAEHKAYVADTNE